MVGAGDVGQTPALGLISLLKLLGAREKGGGNVCESNCACGWSKPTEHNRVLRTYSDHKATPP